MDLLSIEFFEKNLNVICIIVEDLSIEMIRELITKQIQRRKVMLGNGCAAMWRDLSWR